ncbi:helix-turn-helix domain-containing protein, partial [Spirulina subsalsa FACHB-351]
MGLPSAFTKTNGSEAPPFQGGFFVGVYRPNPLYLWYPSIMKSRYQYRIYPTPGQQTELAKLFG